jgi:hypothetical protein
MTNCAIHYCLQDFGKALGLTETLQLADGVLTLRDEKGNHWILQCPEAAELLVVYSPFLAWNPSCPQDTENWLRLNSRFDILRGASIGLHPEHEVFCLFASVPLAVLTGQMLYTLFINLREVRADLAVRLHQPRYGLDSHA